MKKALALVLMGALVAGTLAGCEKDDKKTIGVALPSKELARCLKDEEYLTKDLKAMGYEVDVQFGQGDANIQASQVENMKWMFFRCRRLKELDLESLDTSQVKNMAGMFANCFQLEKLNLLDFQTGQVRDMENMFFYCRNLIRLNLSSFDTRKVENMSRMFLGCSELKELNLSSFRTERVSDMTAMFGHCNDVKELDIRGFDMSLIDSNLSFNEYTKLPGGVRIIRK